MTTASEIYRKEGVAQSLELFDDHGLAFLRWKLEIEQGYH